MIAICNGNRKIFGLDFIFFQENHQIEKTPGSQHFVAV
jgi:hypothetical protein